MATGAGFHELAHPIYAKDMLFAQEMPLDAVCAETLDRTLYDVPAVRCMIADR